MLPSLELTITADPSSALASFETTKKALNGLDRATDIYNNNLKNLDRSLKSGLLSQDKYNAAIEIAEQKYKDAAKGAARLTGATVAFGRTAKHVQGYSKAVDSASGHTANIAAQFNDIGVMLAAGQNPLQLALQQGTQLNQVFSQMGGTKNALKGLIGAFTSMINPMSLATLGIIAGGAALVQWGMSALNAEEDAEAFEDAIKKIEERAISAADKLQMLKLGIATTEELKLQEKIDALIEKRDAFLQQADTARLSSIKAQNQASAFAIQDEIDALKEKQRIALENERALEQEEMRLRQIAASYELMARTRLANETAIEERIKRSHQVYAKTRMEGQELAKEIGTAAANALALAGVDITGPISSAAIEAAKLAANLGISLEAAMSLQNLQGSLQYSGRGGDPRSQGQYDQDGAGDRIQSMIDAFNGQGATGGGTANPLAGQLESIQGALATEAETLQLAYEQQQTTLQEALNNRLLTQEEFQELSLRSSQEYSDAMSEINRREQDAKLSAVSGAFGDLSSLMSTENKKLFNIGKAAAIAEATIDGYQAAISAFKKGMEIGGPPVAAAFAGASLAKTGALISGIASQSIGGGSGSTSAGGGAAATATAPAPLEARISGLDPGSLFTGATVSALFDSLQDEAGDRGLRVSFAQ